MGQNYKNLLFKLTTVYKSYIKNMLSEKVYFIFGRVTCLYCFLLQYVF